MLRLIKFWFTFSPQESSTKIWYVTTVLYMFLPWCLFPILEILFLQGILHSALHNQYWRLIDPQGKPTGVMGWWASRAVTFLENHDTGSTQVCWARFFPYLLNSNTLIMLICHSCYSVFQGHWPFPREKLGQGYAYILTHPGTVHTLAYNLSIYLENKYIAVANSNTIDYTPSVFFICRG